MTFFKASDLDTDLDLHYVCLHIELLVSYVLLALLVY